MNTSHQPTNQNARGHDHGRSHRLRRQAEHVHPLLAHAYRRRAAEIELATWVRTVVTSDAPTDELALAC
jgi:hypothetical protein